MCRAPGVLGGLRRGYKVRETRRVCGCLKDAAVLLPLFLCRSPKEVGDVIALSDITSSGAADHSQEPSPAGSRRGRITPSLSRASSDADHGVSGHVEKRGRCWVVPGRERDRLTD